MVKTKSIFFLLFIIIACGNNRKPGLSDKELSVQNETTDKLEQKLTDFDADNYIVLSGIKYKESRAVDPANPPVVLNIANRNLNIRKFNLSDYYTKVRYIKLKHPKSSAEGNFLFDAMYIIRFNGGGMGSNSGFNSQFTFTDDYIIAGDICFGIHCYNREGTFLYTIESNDFPKTYNVSGNSVSVNESNTKGFAGGLSVYKNLCLYKMLDDNKKSMLCLYDLSRKERIFTKPFERNATFLDANSIASYSYHPLDTARNFLFTFDIKGDTLCRFPSYNPVSERKGSSFFSSPSADIYYYKDQLTIRQSLNDTVYRVVSPNRLVPAYVLNFGVYKIDALTALSEEQLDKLRPKIWKETDGYILFAYTQGRDTPNNRQNGLVKFFYSYFDKKNRQLYHLTEGTTVPENEFLIENPVQDALPFLMSQVNVEKNKLIVYYTKKRLEEIGKNKAFASLSPEQQNKLKTMQSELGESEVLIMILE